MLAGIITKIIRGIGEKELKKRKEKKIYSAVITCAIKESEVHFQAQPWITWFTRWSSHVTYDFHMSIKKKKAASEIPIDRKSEADRYSPPLDIEDVTASSHRTYAKQRSTLASPIVEKWGQPFDPLHWREKKGLDATSRRPRFSRPIASQLPLFPKTRGILSQLFFSNLLFVCLLICYFLFFFTRGSTCTQRAASSWPVGSTLLP